MSISPAGSLSLDAATRRAESVDTLDADAALSRREATLRSVATASLAGIALVQSIELPSLFAQGRQFGILGLAAMALCMALGFALTATPASAGKHVWRLVAAASGLVLAGWVVLHAFSIPGTAIDTQPKWTDMPGGIAAALAAVALVTAIVAVPPTLASIRGLAVAAAVSLALAPGIGVLLVALGPTPVGGEQALAAGTHVHQHGLNENLIVYKALPGGKGGHYVYSVPAAPHQSPAEIALFIGAAFIFTYGAVGFLRRRSRASSESMGRSGLEEGLA